MTTQTLEIRRTSADARLGLGVALGSVAAFLLFVVAPFHVPSLGELPGVETLWFLGSVTAIILGPVCAGLSAWASLVALWTRGDSLTTNARRQHLVTMALAAALFISLVSPWGMELTAWLRD